jgi:hypothetical protein
MTPTLALNSWLSQAHLHQVWLGSLGSMCLAVVTGRTTTCLYSPGKNTQAPVTQIG